MYILGQLHLSYTSNNLCVPTDNLSAFSSPPPPIPEYPLTHEIRRSDCRGSSWLLFEQKRYENIYLLYCGILCCEGGVVEQFDVLSYTYTLYQQRTNRNPLSLIRLYKLLNLSALFSLCLPCTAMELKMAAVFDLVLWIPLFLDYNFNCYHDLSP